MILQLKCPKDTQVIEVQIHDGDIVTKGQALLTLDSTEELRYVATLDETASKLMAHRELLSDDYVNARLDLMKSQIKSYGQSYCLNVKSLAELELEFKGNTRSYLDVLKARKAQLTNPIDEALLRSGVAHDQFTQDVDISRRFIAVAQSLVSAEKEYAARQIDRLSVKAPVDGRIKLFVNVHTPVKRGFILAEIT